MIRKILFCLTLLTICLGLRAADGDWKIHNTFDSEMLNVFDTPDRLYILAYGQPFFPRENKVYNEKKVQLFVHDKSSGETMPYSRRNYLSGSLVINGAYNGKDGYLCLIYNDGNIDLLYDNDKVVNIPAVMNATISDSKAINNISFGLDDNRIYLATDFGFVIIDVKSARIVKARNYHHKILAIAKSGNKLVLADDTHYYVQDADKPLSSLSEFVTVDPGNKASILLPLTDSRLVVNSDSGLDIYQVGADNTLTKEKSVVEGVSFPIWGGTKRGYMFSGSWAMAEIDYTGTNFDQTGQIDTKYYSLPVTSYDGKIYYVLDGRDGIQKYGREGSNWSAKWTKLGTLSRPNAPSVFLAQYMTYSDKYGMLVMTQSQNRLFESFMEISTQISGLKNGEWTNYGYAYTNPEYDNRHRLARGLTPDPTNPDLFYLGSRFQGLQIRDFSNPENMIEIGKDEASANQPWYHLIQSAFFNEPRFDSYGNLWVYNQWSEGKEKEEELAAIPVKCDLGVWTADVLRNKNYKNVKWINTGLKDGPYGDVFPLRSYVNRNIVIVSHGNAPMDFAVYDHNGTIDNTSDDRKIQITNNKLYNQDGGAVSCEYIYDMLEDEDTGIVWVATSNGIFTFQPTKMFDDPTHVRRVKVSRNDGTNLADYLLDGADVRSIAVDGSGNKWFATLGAGLVQTSPDGTHVIRQLTNENSYLPSDNVFKVCYNKGNNSMMVGTPNGIAEYFVPGASSGQGFDMLKVYPNPVRPDFVGYITIEGLMDNTLVKICDAEGNLVKEIGEPYNGIARWDGTNLSGARVNSGVYYVFTSRSGENASEANVAKIMVVR